MEREIKTFTTSSGIKINVKAWLTARERQVINAVMLSNQEISTEDANISDIKLSGDSLMELQNEQLNQYIVSIENDGKEIKDNKLSFLLDLKESEFNEINTFVNNLIQEENKVKKN